MFEKLLAKSSKFLNEAVTIMEHTNSLLIKYMLLKALYPSILTEKEWEILRDACYYHDIGKANTKFQNKLRPIIKRIEDQLKDFEEVPHNYLSCAYMPIEKLMKKYTIKELSYLLMAVYYHHDRKEENKEASEEIIKYDLPQYVETLKKEGFDIADTPSTNYDRYVKKPEELEELYPFIRIKGLLNKIDYAASANISVEIPPEDLENKLDSYIEYLDSKPNELQTYLRKHSEENLVISASTGIGKTEAALYWIGNTKGFFTLPLKVSINAIYDRLKERIGYRNVGLLHSDYYFEYMKRAKEDDEDINLTDLEQVRKLSMPLTITTIDQIIDFVVLYPGCEMKLATLSYSKLVIDEIQMYSPRLVAFIIMGLKYITDMGGKFLIMSATLPPLFLKFLIKEEIPFKQLDKPFLKLNQNGQVISRHVMKIVEKDLTADEVLKRGIKRKTLIIVNTVKKAQALYKEFKEKGIEVQLLHARFIKKERTKKEEAIKRLGEKSNNDSGIWITTQIVEASIDIDFDILFTELSEATGLFQRMGRVYRDRDYERDEPNVYVFSGNPLPSGVSNLEKHSVIDYSAFKKSKEILMKYDGQRISESLKMEIIEQIYNMESLGSDSRYVKKIKQTLSQLKSVSPYDQKFKPDLREFKSVQVIPLSVFNYNKEKLFALVDELESLTYEKPDYVLRKLEIQEEIREFIVEIPDIYFNQKIVKYVKKFRFCPIVKYKYSSELGLILEVDRNA